MMIEAAATPEGDLSCGVFPPSPYLASIYGTTVMERMCLCAVEFLTLPSLSPRHPLPPHPPLALWSQPARMEQGIDGHGPRCYSRFRGSGKWRSGLWLTDEHDPVVTGSLSLLCHFSTADRTRMCMYVCMLRGSLENRFDTG